MRYPIFTYEDGTEVTASKPDADGNISVYIEKFDENKDMFINATIVIPNPTLISSNGYDEDKLNEMLNECSKFQEDIIRHVMDKGRKECLQH